jgi:hypothetical protein
LSAARPSSKKLSLRVNNYRTWDLSMATGMTSLLQATKQIIIRRSSDMHADDTRLFEFLNLTVALRQTWACLCNLQAFLGPIYAFITRLKKALLEHRSAVLFPTLETNSTCGRTTFVASTTRSRFDFNHHRLVPYNVK